MPPALLRDWLLLRLLPGLEGPPPGPPPLFHGEPDAVSALARSIPHECRLASCLDCRDIPAAPTPLGEGRTSSKDAPSGAALRKAGTQVDMIRVGEDGTFPCTW